MGVGQDAVLDPATMRVHGLQGIRVVDASAFPYITNGNTYAPVMMVAEKSADLVLGNTPLPPSRAPIYRLRDGSPLYPPGDPRVWEVAAVPGYAAAHDDRAGTDAIARTTG